MFKNLQPALKWVLSLIAFPLFSTDPTPPPNVLIIFPDQMRSDVMGCMGNQEIKTPHIDQLAKEGVLLLKTYANNPVCCPARAILLTGTYNHINGMTANDLRLREDHITIAELMQQKGYRTGFIGKWHLDGALREPGFVPPGPRRQGFEYWAAYECHHKHFEPYYFRDTPEKLVFNEFEPKVSCDFALEFLNTQPKDKPFFMILQMGPPHDPYGAPKAYMDQYNPEHITPRPNWQPRTEPLPKTKPSLQSIVNGNYNPPIPSGTKNQIAAYYAAVTAIDDQVGRIMAELKRLGLDDNTLILFTSDHGDMLSSHGMHRKRKPHEESAHVPGIIRYPNKIKPTVSNALFSHIDIPPTLLSFCDIPIPKNMQGYDFKNYLLDPTLIKDTPKAILLQSFNTYPTDQVPEAWRGIITERYTYATHADHPFVFFDNQKDPYQLHDLINDPTSQNSRLALHQQLLDLMKKHGDDWSYNAPKDFIAEGKIANIPEVFYDFPTFYQWYLKNK